MKVRQMVVFFKTDRKIEEDTSKFRGFVASMFPEYPILHHHLKEVGFIYSYPKIQYKILEGIPMILGIEEGAEVLRKIYSQIDVMTIGKNIYKIIEKQTIEKEGELSPTRKSISFRFLTPWLSLNPENYKKYSETKDWRKKKELLNGILVGNVLSMCKGLGYVVNFTLHSHSKLDPSLTDFKGLKHVGFSGEFKLNFKIPDFFGLGKAVSQGFGTVKRTE